MDTDEGGGLRYSDHLYFDIITSDDDEPEVEMSSMVGRCPEVTSSTDEGTDRTPPNESVDLRRQQGMTQEDEKMPDYDDESLQQQYFHQMGTGLFNGKKFSKLCLDDLKDVYFPTVLEVERFYYLYLRIVGFSVRRSRREMDENGRVIRRCWVCSKEGKSAGQIEKKKGQDVNLQAKAGEKRLRRGLVSRGVRYSLDEEGRLANLFWRDHQSLLDYKAYSDVLIMDTTYKTNLYRKPLVVFVGCNNHRATVVFGFALIRDEREDTQSHLGQGTLRQLQSKNSAPVFETHIEEDACRLFTYDIFIMIKSQILFEKQFVIVHRAPFPLTDTVVFYIAQYDRPHQRWSVEFQSHETNLLISCSCK
ncbi:hypothetical protein ACLB2K_077153 [Fragaria x ananassa]